MEGSGKSRENLPPRAVRVAMYARLAHEVEASIAGAIRRYGKFREESIGTGIALEDAQGRAWSMASLVARHWLRHPTPSVSSQDDILPLLENDQGWHQGEDMAWLMAASVALDSSAAPDASQAHPPKWRALLQEQWAKLAPDQACDLAGKAIGLLSTGWDLVICSDEAGKVMDRWNVNAATSWLEGAASHPLSTHPRWPGFVCDRVVEMTTMGSFRGVNREEILLFAKIPQQARAPTGHWVAAWSKAAVELDEYIRCPCSLGLGAQASRAAAAIIRNSCCSLAVSGASMLGVDLDEKMMALVQRLSVSEEVSPDMLATMLDARPEDNEIFAQHQRRAIAQMQAYLMHTGVPPARAPGRGMRL